MVEGIHNLLLKTNSAAAPPAHSAKETEKELSQTADNSPQNDKMPLSALFSLSGKKATTNSKPAVQFPDSLKQVQIINSNLGGSTGAKLVKSNDTYFVSKKGNHAEHILAEYGANKVYKALGVPVPEVALYDETSGAKVAGQAKPTHPLMLAEYFQPCIPLGEYLQNSSITQENKDKVIAKLQEHFVIDCLLANWDVIGLESDNVLVTTDGTPIRIDNGSAFEFRAQGGLKKEGFSPNVTELDSMRDWIINPSAASIYGSLSNQEILIQIDWVLAREDLLFKSIDKKYHSSLSKRLEFLTTYKNQLQPAPGSPKTSNEPKAESKKPLKSFDLFAQPINALTSEERKVKAASYGSLSGEEAFSLLVGKPPGTFLLKNSQSTAGALVVCYIQANGKYSSVLLKPSGIGTWIMETSKGPKHLLNPGELLTEPELKKLFLTPLKKSAALPKSQSPLKFSSNPLLFTSQTELHLSGLNNQKLNPAALSEKNKKKVIIPPPASVPAAWVAPVNPVESLVQSYIKSDPEKLLGLQAMGYKISGDQYFQGAEKLRLNFAKELQKDPYIRTSIHQLYDKASEAYSKEKNFDMAFKMRALLASSLKLPEFHPLIKMNDAIARQTAKQGNPDFGAHFSGYDTGILKGSNFRIDRRMTEAGLKDILQFRLSQFARRDLQENLACIEKHIDLFNQHLPKELKPGISIQAIPYCFKGQKESVYSNKFGWQPADASALEITFQGVGRIIVGNNPQYGCLYNDVSVEIDASMKDGQALKLMHQMLTVLGLGPLFAEQRPEDDERLKIAQIFRTYYPSRANELERTKEFYELPLTELKAHLIALVPQMKALLEKYSHPGMMQKVELYPGKTSWALSDIASQLKQKGNYGLMMGVGSFLDLKIAAKRAANMIKFGPISSQDRLQAGIMIHGASTGADLETGGGDRIFTRMINKQTSPKPINNFPFSGSIQLLIDLEALNRGCYAYNSDKYGIRNPVHYNYYEYAKRASILDFTATQTDNEVMLKNRIDPQYIKGAVVQNQGAYEQLVEALKEASIVKSIMGKDYVYGKPIEQFIKIAHKFDPSMWN
ncbi:SH2 domain-containing protein [Criblamydia sequanensis]|uniref:Uncharacterized protein n=1 Tax=Candidatus Criblamydia sequanensis CRIB-18 TaxID=1437425 RepID=A0A090D1R2_9BACT|nr:SH2 domain-containing protein [Criblamydia sequanensis]CDR34005.1 Conserved hypothetical protein [Criblamydia sequanensis CRIB-18]